MHIHGNSMNVNAANFYSVGNSEKAAAERAAAVRKKLMKGAATVEGAETPEESLMIGRWLDSSPSQNEGDADYHSAASGKDSDFG
jgi:hypothetical protein